MSEHAEQVALFAWARMQESVYPDLRMMFAVPNGARTSIGAAMKLKAEGLRAGVPDIWLPVPRRRCHGLVIEMKYGRNKTSLEQDWWLEMLTRLGWKSLVCYGHEQAKCEILDYLEN